MYHENVLKLKCSKSFTIGLFISYFGLYFQNMARAFKITKENPLKTLNNA